MKQKLKIILLFLIMAMFLGGCNMQNRFLYFPEPEWPTARTLEYENMKLWQATAADYQGLIAARKRPRPMAPLFFSTAMAARRSTEDSI